METRQINPLVIIAALVVVVGLIGFFGYKAVMPPTPPAGSYTPGMPPWMDKKHPVAAGVHASP